MRYEPLNSLVKNKYVSPHWTAQQIESVAHARRVLGFGGAFPPYQALLDKFRNANSFEEAFSLRPGPGQLREPKGVAGLIECPTEQLSASRANFRELLNDPATLLTGVRCENCDIKVQAGEAAFAVQNYTGKYIGYVCPLCHPNRKWINGLWRSALGDVFSQNGSQTGPLLASIISRTVH